MDPAANFAKSAVSTGYDETALTVTLESTDPNLSRWPDPATVGAYNATWWDATTYADPADDPNVEIVRITAKSGAQLTVTRAQEGTVATAKDTSGSAYKMVIAPTKKLIDDLQESQIDSGTAYGWITDAPYSAAGDGTTDDHDAFEDAAAALTTIVVPSGTYRIASSLTIGSGVSLHMLEGAQFSIDAGVTLTVNGNIIAGNYQIWSGSGTLTLSARQLIRYARWDGTAANRLEIYGQTEWVDVRSYGAVGDSSTDDTTALAAAIASGMDVYLPRTSGDFTTTASLDMDNAGQRIFGPGAIRLVTLTSLPVIEITANNVVVDGITIRGRQYAASEWGAHGVRVYGAETARLSGVKVLNCTIYNCGSDGIRSYYLDHFQFRGNRIYNCADGGIEDICGHYGDISHNDISDITTGTAANMYGIAVTTVEDAGVVRTSDITIIGNRVQNVDHEGIDVHGGERITIQGNTILGCIGGIVVTDGEDNYAGRDIAIVGNTIDGTGQTISFGINFEGPANLNEYATGSILGNTISNIGGDGSHQTYSGIYLQGTRGMAVAGNKIKKSILSSILLYSDNQDFVIEGNTLIDTYRASGSSYPFWASGDNNRGTIGNNPIGIEDTALTNLNSYAISIGNYSTNFINWQNRAALSTTAGGFDDAGDALIRGAATVTSGTGEDVIGSATFRAGSIKIDSPIRITLRGANSGANDTKTIKFKWGSGSVTFMAANNNAYTWWASIIVRQYSTTYANVFWSFYTSGPTMASGNYDSTSDISADIALQVTGECANAGDTVRLSLLDIDR
jgi:parallel beta-helix repeat protein